MERRFWGSSMKRTQETFVYIGPQSLDTWIYMSDFQLEHPGRWQEAQLFRLWQLPFRNCPGVSGAVIVRIHSQSWGGSSCWLPRVGEGLDASSPTSNHSSTVHIRFHVFQPGPSEVFYSSVIFPGCDWLLGICCLSVPQVP